MNGIEPPVPMSTGAVPVPGLGEGGTRGGVGRPGRRQHDRLAVSHTVVVSRASDGQHGVLLALVRIVRVNRGPCCVASLDVVAVRSGAAGRPVAVIRSRG
jgi:hypothetical protein